MWGGATVGLMGEVARAARAAGGRTIGVIPESLQAVEIADHAADELVITPDMLTRKAELAQPSRRLRGAPWRLRHPRGAARADHRTAARLPRQADRARGRRRVLAAPARALRAPLPRALRPSGEPAAPTRWPPTPPSVLAALDAPPADAAGEVALSSPSDRRSGSRWRRLISITTRPDAPHDHRDEADHEPDDRAQRGHDGEVVEPLGGAVRAASSRSGRGAPPRRAAPPRGRRRRAPRCTRRPSERATAGSTATRLAGRVEGACCGSRRTDRVGRARPATWRAARRRRLLAVRARTRGRRPRPAGCRSHIGCRAG